LVKILIIYSNIYIKGKYKFVETFDENKHDYRTKIVHNKFYPDEFDFIPVENFERKDIKSKFDLILLYSTSSKIHTNK